MKKIVTVTEVDGAGLEALLGENVILFCCNYFYADRLSGVNTTFVELEDAKLVYETGALTADTWKDAQPLPSTWYVQTNAIESFGKSGR